MCTFEGAPNNILISKEPKRKVEERKATWDQGMTLFKRRCAVLEPRMEQKPFQICNHGLKGARFAKMRN